MSRATDTGRRDPAPSDPPRPDRRDPVDATSRWRWWFVGLLLAGEFATLVTRFSIATLRVREGAWSAWIEQAGVAPQILLLSGLAILFLRRTHLESELAAWRAAISRPRLGAARVLAQAASFGALYLACVHVFEEDGASASVAWRIVFGLATLATCLTALALIAPLGAWWRAARAASLVPAAAAFVAVAAWGLGLWVQRVLGPALRGPTLALSRAVLELFSDDVHTDAAEFVLGTGTFQVRVAPQCSGFEGVGLIAVFTVAYLVIERRRLRFPAALALPLAGVVLAWALNLARLVGLILVGTYVSPRLAVEGFHSLIGLVCFSVLALGLVWAAQRSRWLVRESADPPGERAGRPTPAYLLPFLALVLASTLAQAFQVLDASAYALRLAPAIALLAAYRGHYARLGWRPTWAAWAVGAALCAVWVPLAGADPVLADGGDALFVAGRALGFVVVAPLCEELAFRGYLMRRLTSGEFARVAPGATSLVAWIGSSVLFALAHGGQWLAALLAGLAYGWVYRRSGRIGDAVVAHALTNALLLAWELLR